MKTASISSEKGCRTKTEILYKRFVTFSLGNTAFCLLTAGFAFIWYNYYVEELILPYYKRGNWVLIAIYAILVWLFIKAYGGFKLGYLKKTDMLYSQLISIVSVNFVAYFIISLIGRHFMLVPPMVLLTCADIAVISVWTLLMGKLYFMIYPPRKLMILYGSHQAASLVLKMSQRVDKYMICESVSITESPEKIRELILKYEGVIICDIPAEERNDYLKFCYRTIP